MHERSVFECPEGHGKLTTRSPVDGRFHCLKCGYSASMSEVIGQLGGSAVGASIESGIESYMGDLDEQEFVASILKVADAIPGRVRESYILAARKKLVAICEEVESAVGMPAHPAVRVNVLAMILNWPAAEAETLTLDTPART
jgi:hypothetical protein